MSSSSPKKTPCVADSCKSLGILKCEGCSQIFCRKHVNEHRDALSHQWDEIVLEHDTLKQTINKQNDEENNHQALLEQIDQWERVSIVKIQQTAEEARQQVKRSVNSETTSKELQNLGEQLREAQIDDDYVETDLRRWTAVLENLKHDIHKPSPVITICEDSTETLVARMSVSITEQQTKFDELFGELYGQIRVENKGHVAKHYGEKKSNAFVRGRGEYSSGKHRILFIINKQTASCDILFGIVSKQMCLSRLGDDSERSIFGWWSNDEICPRNISFNANKTVQDLKDKTTLEIDLLLDCDKQTISYFNVRTRATRELNIDIKKCPFPWQLVFNLYNGGDQVRLIPSHKTD
jgi:hypothetical protein